MKNVPFDVLHALALQSLELTENLAKVRAEAKDADQLDLFADGADRACEDFMAEREELNAALKGAQTEVLLAKGQLRQELDSHRVYTDGLRSQITKLQSDAEKANAVMLHIADFARELKARLNSIGIDYIADSETGEPNISVNVVTLDRAVRDMIERS